MATTTLLPKVKLALGLTDATYDSELTGFIFSAYTDLNFGNVDTISETDELTTTAIILFCSYQFQLIHGAIDRANAIKGCYDSIKTQMGGSSYYRDWENDNG